ncbi:lysozyme inhibitor LprI family protein [Klebsiella pneumoniae]|uniref:lysozyme inhibitor LprI family protein n=1 Tax=Klebsiella pneumoniae TaxID=573 RepID=UPI0011599C12|nr:hypothetical protein [Klebsiella pneumoniae]
MKTSIILAFLSVSLCAGSSFAASFDCNKSKNFAEKTICSDKKLSEDDEVLAKVYNLAKKVARIIKMGSIG